jgi:DNA-binding MarR family transcriptional regulator
MRQIEKSRSKVPAPGSTKAANRKRGALFSPPLTVSHPSLLVDNSDDTFRQVIYTFVEVLGRLTICREAFGRAIGLTGSQFAVLFGVAYRQGEHGVTIKRLAQYVHLAPTHVTTEVGRLIRGGLIAKRAANDDRRSVLVSLTEGGEKTVMSVAPFVTQVNDVLFEGMTSADLASAESLFSRLSRNSEFALAQLKVAERKNYWD